MEPVFDTGACSTDNPMTYLFGIRSPLVVDYEESAIRLKYNVTPVSIDGKSSRCVIFEEYITAEQVRSEQFYIACAFMPPRRLELVTLAAQLKLLPAPALIDSTAIIASSSEIAEGSYCNCGVTIGGMTSIGQHSVINRGSSIGHHVLFDDFVSLGPSVTLSGGVMVGSGAMIGAGSVVLPGVKIGNNAIVAAGSVVTKSVADDTLVAGVPAQVKKQGSVYNGVSKEGEE